MTENCDPKILAYSERVAEAMQAGNISEIKAMLEAGTITANSRIFIDGDWGNPISLAIVFDLVDVVKLLIDAGADVDDPGDDDELTTPLNYAVQHDKTEIARLLIDAGANVNTKDDDGRSPLHYAVGEGYSEIVQLLVNAGANVNARDNERKTPLHLAAGFGGNLEIVRLLVNAGADIELVDRDALDAAYYAAHGRNVKEDICNFITEVVKEKKKKLETTLKTQQLKLFSAICTQQPAVVREAISEGADVNGWKELSLSQKYAIDTKAKATPLCSAITGGRGNIEIIKILLEEGADANIPNFAPTTSAFAKPIMENVSPISYAANANMIEVVKLLLAFGADVRGGVQGLSMQRPPFWVAVVNDNYEMAKLLLETYAKHNLKVDETWLTDALSNAIDNENVDMLKLLLDSGADINTIVGSYGYSLLHYAAVEGNEDIVKELLSLGADVNIEDHEGLTVLQNDDVSPEIQKIIEEYANEKNKTDVSEEPFDWSKLFGE